MNKNYAPCFYRIDFVVIPSFVELPRNTFVSVCPRLKKFNIVSNNHGRTKKCDVCTPVSKTNFTDRHTPNTIMEYDTWF